MEPASITINDIISAVNIIDTCSERGAFKGPELTSVGMLREKLVKFVNENQPKQQSAEAAKTEKVAEQSETGDAE